MATLYWRYEDEFGHPVPDQDTYLRHFPDHTAAMLRVMAMGQKLAVLEPAGPTSTPARC